GTTTARTAAVLGVLVCLLLPGCAQKPAGDASLKDASLDARRFNEAFLSSERKRDKAIEIFGDKFKAAIVSRRADDFAEAHKAYEDFVQARTTLWVEWKAVKPPELPGAQKLPALYLRLLEKSEGASLKTFKEMSEILEDQDRSEGNKAAEMEKLAW